MNGVAAGATIVNAHSSSSMFRNERMGVFAFHEANGFSTPSTESVQTIVAMGYGPPVTLCMLSNCFAVFFAWRALLESCSNMSWSR